MTNPRVIEVAPNHLLDVDAYTTALGDLLLYNNSGLIPAYRALRTANAQLREASERTRQFLAGTRTVYELIQLASEHPPTGVSVDSLLQDARALYRDVQSIVEAYPIMDVTHPTLSEQRDRAAEDALELLSDAEHLAQARLFFTDPDASRASLRSDVHEALLETMAAIQEELANTALDDRMARQAAQALDRHYATASTSPDAPTNLPELLLVVSSAPGVLVGNMQDAGDSCAVALLRWALLRMLMKGRTADFGSDFNARGTQLGRAARLTNDELESVKLALRQGRLRDASEETTARFQNGPAISYALTALSALQFIGLLAQTESHPDAEVEEYLALGSAGISAGVNIVSTLSGQIALTDWILQYQFLRSAVTRVGAGLNVIAAGLGLVVGVIDVVEGVQAGDTERWTMGAINAAASAAIFVASVAEIVVVCSTTAALVEGATVVAAVAGPIGAVLGAAAIVVGIAWQLHAAGEAEEAARHATFGRTCSSLCAVLLGAERRDAALGAAGEPNPAARMPRMFTPAEYTANRQAAETARLQPPLLPIVTVLDREANTNIAARLRDLQERAAEIRTPMHVGSADEARVILRRLRALGFDETDRRTQRMLTRDNIPAPTSTR